MSSSQELETLMPDASQFLSNEPEIESLLHYAQLTLLVVCLEFLWRDRTNRFQAHLSLRFPPHQAKAIADLVMRYNSACFPRQEDFNPIFGTGDPRMSEARSLFSPYIHEKKGMLI